MAPSSFDLNSDIVKHRLCDFANQGTYLLMQILSPPFAQNHWPIKPITFLWHSKHEPAVLARLSLHSTFSREQEINAF